MELIRIYQCLCDETRLRILNLLLQGPLCVCHLQSLLGKGQVQISQHLAYLKKRGLVQSQKQHTWAFYSLPQPLTPDLSRHLACLQDCCRSHDIFRNDIKSLRKLQKSLALSCCKSSSPSGDSNKSTQPKTVPLKKSRRTLLAKSIKL
ncbi:MAG: winged helix-turn-helix transcriptional regulator [Blastochloris sp.]|nr:winged helix-turn-helix transcriptional regulator [Blastochloris sp.]